MKVAKVAVLLDQEVARQRWKYGVNVFEGYIQEVLAQGGIPFHLLGSLREAKLSDWDVVIVALAADDADTAERLWAYAEQGGTLVSYGGLHKLAKKLGCVRQSPIEAGYAYLPDELGDPRPLRSLDIRPWLANDCAEGRSGLQVEHIGTIAAYEPEGKRQFGVLQKFQVGQGTIERFSVNIPYTIVGFQQGLHPVVEDGLPAPDGTANVDEGILKADDGIQLDWSYDRLQTESGQMYYAHPYADLWREVCLRHLLRSVVGKGLTLPVVGYWPDGVSSVAMLSHDSDGNVDEHAESTLKILRELGLQTTWCMLEPGYSEHLYEQVAADGHELAFHYNALEEQGGKWGKDEFNRQFAWLKSAAPAVNIITNKNHYTCYEGWGELFQWCELNGIQVDQSRGASKGGNVGFLFGTCQTYFPIAWADESNRLYDVLELSFLTQDMDIGLPWGDSSIITPFLEQVKLVEGVAHFLAHQVHIHTKPRVVDSLRVLVTKARELGFTFWTSQQINNWVRRRRQVVLEGLDPEGNVIVAHDAGLSDIVVWIPVAENEHSSLAADIQLKFGVPCRKQIIKQSNSREMSI